MVTASTNPDKNVSHSTNVTRVRKPMFGSLVAVVAALWLSFAVVVDCLYLSHGVTSYLLIKHTPCHEPTPIISQGWLTLTPSHVTSYALHKRARWHNVTQPIDSTSGNEVTQIVSPGDGPLSHPPPCVARTARRATSHSTSVPGAHGRGTCPFEVGGRDTLTRGLGPGVRVAWHGACRVPKGQIQLQGMGPPSRERVGLGTGLSLCVVMPK